MTPLENNGHGRTIALALGALIAGGIAILWSWNTLAADLFTLPVMEFRHAVAVELLLVVAGALFGLRGAYQRKKAG